MRKKGKKDPFDGHVVEVFLDEDGDWLARFEDLPEISAFSDSPEGAVWELARAWGLVRESRLERGEGPIASRAGGPRLQLRLGRRTFRALAREAARQGLSLHAFAERKLTAGLTRALRSPEGRG